MIEKKIVEKNFSKSILTYEKYAVVQKKMAKTLVELIDKEGKKENILEIGCGTGLFTEFLLENFYESKFDILDISKKMIEVSKQKFENKINKYIVEDAEKYKSNQKYDLIVSNASFQWFKNINDSILKLLKLLNKNGEIVFSIFAEDTYKELRKTFFKLDPEYIFSQKFVSKEILENLNNDQFELKILKEELFIQEFESLYEFLKAIKGVGANSALKNKKILTRRVIEEAEKIYLKNYKKIKVTNHLLYVKLKRK